MQYFNTILLILQLREFMIRLCHLLVILLICHTAYGNGGIASCTSGKMLAFRENAGQITDQCCNYRSDIQFQTSINGLSVFISAGKVSYQWNHLRINAQDKTGGRVDSTQFPTPDTFDTYRLDVVLIGANTNAVVIKENELPDPDIFYTNGLNGAHAGSFQRITYKNVYPNIDWVLYSKGTDLKYDFIVHPGGNISDIRIKYAGADNMSVVDGEVVIQTPMGSITEEKPYSYSADDKKEIASRFLLNNDVLSFEAAAYDGTLIVDPELRLEWATYYGGSGTEAGQYGQQTFVGFAYYGNSVATDKNHDVYMSGTTNSIDNIATAGAYQTTISDVSNSYLVKFNSVGERLWSTYFGGYNNGGVVLSYGTAAGRGHSIACDTLGNVYMTGNTFSDTGIATPSAYQMARAGTGWPDLYLAKFNSNGNREWATFFGNPRIEEGGSLAVSADGKKIFFAGASQAYTPTTDVIATPGALFPPLPTSQSQYTGFLTCFNPQGQKLWGTYIASVFYVDCTVYDIALDPQGYIYLTGYVKPRPGDTNSIATVGSYQSQFSGYIDGFLQKWDTNGNRLWGTYYGANNPDGGYALACDGKGNVYMSGFSSDFTNSVNGPFSIASQGSYIDSYPTDGASFLAKFSGSGQREWATYYYGYYLAVGGSGGSLACKDDKVYLLVNTNTDSAATPCAYQTDTKSIFPGSTSTSAHLAIFNDLGEREYATYFGGGLSDWAYSLALDEKDNRFSIYMGGNTFSPSRIATQGAYKTVLGGQLNNQRDAFLAKFTVPVASQISITAPCFSKDSVLLTAWDSLANNYQWNNGANGYTTWAPASGTYIVSYEKESGCVSTDTFLVDIEEQAPLPELSIQDNCPSFGIAKASVSDGNTDAYTYTWYDKAGTQIKTTQSISGDTLTRLSSGNYMLEIQAGNGCDTMLSFVVENLPPATVSVKDDSLTSMGGRVQLEATGADSYVWSPDEWLDNAYTSSPAAKPLEPITYTVVGTNSYGCKDTATVYIDINEQFFVPNAFSPNGDGLNDVFGIGNLGHNRLIEFRVFNRWGEVVFVGDNFSKGWNGYYKDKVADVGVYNYIIRLNLASGRERTYKGDVTLIR